MLSRGQLIAQYGCPRCGASAGSPCTGSRGQERKSQHIERWNAAGVTHHDLTDYAIRNRRR